MKRTELQMGMPIAVEIVGDDVPEGAFSAVYDWFRVVDERFSTYKPDSEVSRINRGLPESEWSDDMKAVLVLCSHTKQQTNGYFDVYHGGQLDPSGLVKGWSIERAARLLLKQGYRDFCIDAGGDVQVHGHNAAGMLWRVGIRNPFNRAEIVKVVHVQMEGVATSGAYIRGEHIYNPHVPGVPPKGVASITVIGPNIYEADRFATAAYAMGLPGIRFIESLDGLEAYMIDMDGMATMTSNFERYIVTR